MDKFVFEMEYLPPWTWKIYTLNHILKTDVFFFGDAKKIDPFRNGIISGPSENTQI